MVSPPAISPNGNNETEQNPFESEFVEDEEGDEEDEDMGDMDFSTPSKPEESNFAVLNSSLPGDHRDRGSDKGSGGSDQQQPHHLASYASAKRSTVGNSAPGKKEKQHRTRWHFGIRSRSPPMEVMSAIYASLKSLGMEWKEKRDLGGLCAMHPRAREHQAQADGSDVANGSGNNNPVHIERAREWDGHGHSGAGGRVDLRAASSIYFVETRARHDDVIVFMNIQLYYVDGDNYLVDFHHKHTVLASAEPGAGKWDVAGPIVPSASAASVNAAWNGSGTGNTNNGNGSETGSMFPVDPHAKEETVVSPYIFMDVACKLILDLAGGADDGR
jgi:carbon catabolite-derepressing protein kinase